MSVSDSNPTRKSEVDSLILQVESGGFCIIEDVIPPECCAQIRDHVNSTVARLHGDSTPFPRDKIRFLSSLINHDQSFAEYLAAPRLLDVLHRLLGEHLRISFTTAIINQPGNARHGWHADWPFNQGNAGHIPAPYPDVRLHITTLWMLSPFGKENGGTFLLPGSHRLSVNPTLQGPGVPRPLDELPGEVQAHGEAGSVLVFDSRLWHATAPNQSAEPRVALAVRYAPWWLNLDVLRPESEERKRMCDETGIQENMEPAIIREVFDRLPEPVKTL